MVHHLFDSFDIKEKAGGKYYEINFAYRTPFYVVRASTHHMWNIYENVEGFNPSKPMHSARLKSCTSKEHALSEAMVLVVEKFCEDL